MLGKPSQLTKDLLLTRMRQMVEENGGNDELSKYNVIKDCVTELEGDPRKGLVEHELDLSLDELHDEGKIRHLGRGRLKVISL